MLNPNPYFSMFKKQGVDRNLKRFAGASEGEIKRDGLAKLNYYKIKMECSKKIPQGDGGKLKMKHIDSQPPLPRQSSEEECINSEYNSILNKIFRN